MFLHESRPPCLIFHDFFTPHHYFLSYCDGYASCQHVYSKQLISWLWWCTVAVGVDTITSVSDKRRTQHVYNSYSSEKNRISFCFASLQHYCQTIHIFSPNVTGVKGSHILNDNLHMNGAVPVWIASGSGYLLKEYFDWFRLKKFSLGVPSAVYLVPQHVQNVDTKTSLEITLFTNAWKQKYVISGTGCRLIFITVLSYALYQLELTVISLILVLSVRDNSAFPFCFHSVWFPKGWKTTNSGKKKIKTFNWGSYPIKT